MADTKVSNLDSITVADNNDVLYIVDTSASASKKITFQNLLSGVNLSINNLDSTVTEFTSLVTDLSADVDNANINIGPLVADVITLSTNQSVLSSRVSELEDLPTYGLSDSYVLASSTFTFLSGILITVTS